MFQRLNHPLLTALVTAVCYFVFLLLTLNQRDPGTFPQAGKVFTNTEITPGDIETVTEFTGYDGQFYYRLALNPFTRELTNFGIQFDSPRYRHQRIMYPLLAWLFSFGSPPMVTYALIFVNFLALCFIGFAAGQIAHLANRHVMWGLMLSLYPGFLLTLSRDLVEITEAAFLLAGLVSLARSRAAVATASLSLGLLAKETALLAALALISQKKYWKVAIMPLAIFATWQLFLNIWWGRTLGNSVWVNIGWPFLGLIQGKAITPEPQRWIVGTALLGAFFFSVLISLKKSEAERYLKIGWGFYLILLLLLTKNVWVEDWAFLRAATLGYVFGTAVLLQARGRLIIGGFLATLAVWFWLAADLLIP